jgi:methionyl-tRNA formyltransferase
MVSAPEVKRVALELGLPVYQPQKVKTGELEQWLVALGIDVAIVLAYGRILPPPVLRTPRKGCLNLHASLLPKYRGAAPINWAIAHGETETGISLMQMDDGLDTGPVFTRRAISIGPDETAGQLAERLALLAAEVVTQDVPRAIDGTLEPSPQDPARASHAPPITREHLRIDWQRPASEIANLIRAMAPKPGAFTSLRGKIVKVLAAHALAETGGAAGEVDVEGGRVVVTSGSGKLEIVTAQLEGRKQSLARELVNGRVFRPGDVLGTT